MSISLKERAQRRLRSLRKDGLEYDPRPGPSTSAAFSESPVLYYSVYDKNLSQVRKGLVYAHSLEELYYMAIDNAARLDTLDLLFRLRPDFSSRTMTIRDLILTAFVGTSDGTLNSMLVCPYQGNSPYSLDTTLYATVMSDLVRNARDTPLRIALNVPTAMQKWSHTSKLRMFGASVDSKLIELNNRVNCKQIVDLRNDPEGAVRYSQKALEAMRASQKPAAAQQVAPSSVEPISNGAESGTAVETNNNSGDEAVSAEPDTTAAIGSVVDHSAGSEQDDAQDPSSESRKAITESRITNSSADNVSGLDRAPIAEVPGAYPDQNTDSIDVSAITGPLQAAQLKDNTTTELDSVAVDASTSHPAFESLEHSTGATVKASAADEGYSDTKRVSEHFTDGQTMTDTLKTDKSTVATDGDDDGIAPALKRDE